MIIFGFGKSVPDEKPLNLSMCEDSPNHHHHHHHIIYIYIDIYIYIYIKGPKGGASIIAISKNTFLLAGYTGRLAAKLLDISITTGKIWRKGPVLQFKL